MFRELDVNANQRCHMMPKLVWQHRKANWVGKDCARAILVKALNGRPRRGPRQMGLGKDQRLTGVTGVWKRGG